MRNFQFALISVCAVVLAGCDDGNTSGSICDKSCGAGSCFVQGTLEKCLCEDGYQEDANGSCTLCIDGYQKVNGTCEPESVCTGQCTGDHMSCSVSQKKPVCECDFGFDLLDGVCEPWAECLTTFKFTKADAAGTAVYLTGDFDHWSTNTYPMTETSSGVFELALYLEPGSYGYKYYIPSWNDKWIGSDGTTSGQSNYALTVTSCESKLSPKLILDDVPTVSGGTASFSVSVVDKLNTAGDISVSIVKNDGTRVSANQNGTSWSVADPMGSAKKVGYTVSATTGDGTELEPIFVPVWNEETAFNWRDAVIYFTFTDRFYNGNSSNDNPLGTQIDWAGGDFVGLKQKVEEGYFDNLGVNTLWISSPSMNTQSVVSADGFTMSAYHSYWPISTGYTEKNASMFEGATSNGVAFTPIEPHFGTLDELKDLVETCHNKGMRVLVDFAVNHVNSESPVFQQHPEWFNYYNYEDKDSILCAGPNQSQSNWNIIPETCWFGDNLPDFNYELAEVREFVLEHAKWLIRTTNIDGFRLDAVKHMPIQFIKELRTTIDGMMENSGQTFYIVGETFDGADMINKYIGDDMLHGQFDFPLYNAIRDSIMKAEGKFYNLKDHVNGNVNTFGDAIMSTFLGNHDVARAISYIHGDSTDKYGNNPEVSDSWAYLRLKLAWTFLMTSPGVPMIYYGDEFGLEGANDPDNRRMMKFDGLNQEQQTTIEFMKRLGQVRRAHPALSRGTRTSIDAYERSYMYLMKDENETILVGISDTSDTQTYHIDEGTKGWINLLDESETISDTTDVSMYAGRQIIVWKLKD